MIPRIPLFRSILWGLLCLWVFFGCLELAEQLQVVGESVAEDQTHQDLDEDALVQLASGLKSDNVGLCTAQCASSMVDIAALVDTPPVRSVHRFRPPMRYGPRSLRRHQELSVYRI